MSRGPSRSHALQVAFHDRAQAGQELVRRLTAYRDRKDAIVLALPRGGVPVGVAVAEGLHLPLDVLVVDKVRVPGEMTATIGAVASGGIRVIDRDLVQALELPGELVERLFVKAEEEVARRELLYRAGLPPLDLHGKTVIVVDDGVATGASIRAAIAAAERMDPAALVAAVPISTFSVCAELSRRLSLSVCIFVRDPVYAVHLWYDELPRISDEEVVRLLSRTTHAAPAAPSPG